jgi:uroporphyrinogen III methyltransferase/synthase
VTVVGDVARMRDQLAWFERRPLLGRSVVVTRARAQASGLAARLRALGAEAIEAPAIRIVPRHGPDLDRALDEIGGYALVCLTSPNGVRLLAAGLTRRGRDARALAGATIAAIGPGTARELLDFGIRADVVPERSVAEALVEALETVPVDGRRVLVARAAEARDVLPDALRERGAQVDVVELYDTVPEELSEDRLQAVASADYVTFTSSSTVRFFMSAVGGNGVGTGARIVSIGPVTSATAREHGLEVHVEAERHDVDGLVEALVRDADSAPGRA